MGGEPLIAAVRSGDAKAVLALLDAGADPNAADEQGTPALCLAVDAFDLPVVEALLLSNIPVRLDRAAADGRTPLLRAVDRGACEIASVLVTSGADPRLEDAEGRDALALARHWHETGVETELRRRSCAASEPVRRRAVRDGWDNVCEELSLAGLTVRNGHTAVLTELEPRYGITPPFAELMARALAEPDADQPVWVSTTLTLHGRRDPAVWEAAAALRDRPDPLERCFGAQMLYLTILFDESEDGATEEPLVDVVLPWVAREGDAQVTRALTAALANAFPRRARQPLPALTRHHDAQVRRTALSGLHGAVSEGDPEALAAATAGTRDGEAVVREGACRALADAPRDSPAPSDALAACLHDEDEVVRVTAAIRLALRDDPRGDGVLRAFDGVGQESPYYWDLYQVRHHRRAKDEGAAQ